MFLSAYLAIVLGQPVPEGFVPENTADKMSFRLVDSGKGTSFDWSDTEERVRGTVTPGRPAAGEEVTISVAVGSFSGAPYEGPVTLGLEEEGGGYRQLETVPGRTEEPRVWNATFVPPDSGAYTIEIAFRTSHQKSIKGKLDVGLARVSTTVALGLGLGAILAAIGYGLFILFVKKEGGASEASGPPPAA